MKKIIGMVIGSLFFVLNANAAELGVDVNSGINSAGADLVLELSGIDYSYPATVLKGSEFDVGNRDAGPGFGYHADSTLVGWSEYPGGLRLTAGMFENDPRAKWVTNAQTGVEMHDRSAKSDLVIDSHNDAASAGKSVSNSSGERSAERDGRLKLAVGVGTTSLEPDIDLQAELNAGGFDGMDQAELAALLNEVETETTIDLEDYFVRPVLAIGVNYAF